MDGSIQFIKISDILCMKSMILTGIFRIVAIVSPQQTSIKIVQNNNYIWINFDIEFSNRIIQNSISKLIQIYLIFWTILMLVGCGETMAIILKIPVKIIDFAHKISDILINWMLSCHLIYLFVEFIMSLDFVSYPCAEMFLFLQLEGVVVVIM